MVIRTQISGFSNQDQGQTWSLQFLMNENLLIIDRAQADFINLLNSCSAFNKGIRQVYEIWTAN